jgi:hypothetical protein
MNPKQITVQAPIQIPPAPQSGGTHFLHVIDTADGFAFRWVPLSDCPVYVRSTTGERARLTMSLTNRIADIPKHGKAVLIFEEFLATEDGSKRYSTWNPNEWFRSSEA